MTAFWIILACLFLVGNGFLILWACNNYHKSIEREKYEAYLNKTNSSAISQLKK